MQDYYIEAIRRQIIEQHTIRGEVKSVYEPLTLERRILLYECIKKATEKWCDAESILQGLISYITAATGKKTRVTRATRLLYRHLYTTTKQYKKNNEVAIPTTLYGYKHKDTLHKHRKVLEQAGLIKLTDAKWAYNSTDKSRNRAPKYRITEEMKNIIIKIHESTEKGTRGEGHKVEINTDGSSFAIRHKAVNNVTKLKQYQVARRNKSVAAKWRIITDSELKESGLYDKITLTSHSLAIGDEVDDATISRTITNKYQLDKYMALESSVESSLPVSHNGVGLHHSYRVNIKRDKGGKIKSIGCRPNAGLCQTYNEDHEEFYGVVGEKDARSTIMKELNLNFHYDVPCSIYNLNIALNIGKFEPKDIYSAIANRLNITRKDAKICLMKANFGIFAEQCARNPYGKKAATKMVLKNPITKERREFDFTYKDVQDAMRAEGLTIQGRSTAIFVHEAWIYALVRHYLLTEEANLSVRVYDSFYTRYHMTKNEFKKLINRAVQAYLSKVLDDNRLGTALQ